MYPDLSHPNFNEWMQESNPAIEENIRGFESISLAYKHDGEFSNDFAGLGRNKNKPELSGNCVIDDLLQRSSWWYCIGCMHRDFMDKANMFPGPRISTSSKKMVKNVRLYAKRKTGVVKFFFTF